LVFPDAETMRAVLTLATHAPSTHDTQPWRWRVGPDTLTLFADPSRHGSHTGPDRRDLLISGGATLHHCTVALAAMGWRSKVHRLPDPACPDLLATVTVSVQPPGELDVLLAGAIARRRCDRRNYSPCPVPWGDIALMGARAARAGVMLRQIEPSEHIKAIIAGKGRRGSMSGVQPFTIPEPAPGTPIAGRMFAAPAPEQFDTGPTVEHNGVVVALGTQLDDDLARLRAGEATSLVLLSATAMGLASCPVSEPLAIPETRDTVRADVFGGTGYPQMLMRFGWAPANAEPLPAAPRRPLPEVADWLSAG
jgi:nitroreductase